MLSKTTPVIYVDRHTLKTYCAISFIPHLFIKCAISFIPVAIILPEWEAHEGEVVYVVSQQLQQSAILRRKANV